MIADGRETALIPFMLRPFRCTDTRGRHTGPRRRVPLCVCALVAWACITCAQMILVCMCGKNPHITLSECIKASQDQNASNKHTGPHAMTAGPLGLPPNSLNGLKTKKKFSLCVLLSVLQLEQMYSKTFAFIQVDFIFHFFF